MRLVLIYYRFPPYHAALFEAAGRRGSIVAVEASPLSPESPRFHGATLFAEAGAEWRPISQLRQRFDKVLTGLAPGVVAISSWGHAVSLCALEWCFRNRVPAVIVNDSQQRDFPRKPWKEGLKRRVLRHVAAGFAAGTRSAQYLSSLGPASDRVTTGCNVIDNRRFAAIADEARRGQAAARSRLDLPNRFLLACARFVPKKNLLGLLDAYAVVAGEPAGAGWDLVLLGDGPEKARLEARVERLRIGARVRMPGYPPPVELPSYYGLASGFAHVSHREQWGLVVNEALVAGLPVVVSEACGCVPELVEDGVNGFLCRAEDPQSTVGALRRLLSMSPEQLDRMGGFGRRRIAEFTPERFAEGLWHSTEVAARHGAPAVPLTDRLLALALARKLRGAEGD